MLSQCLAKSRELCEQEKSLESHDRITAFTQQVFATQVLEPLTEAEAKAIIYSD